jgi:hypothetical protein
MKIVKKLISLKLMLISVTCVFSSFSSATSIEVLWYGGSDFYNTLPPQLAVNAGDYDPNGDGSLDWNVTLWEDGQPDPMFGNYDVFIIPSWLSGMDSTRLLGASDEITEARGSRTFLSGQDADFHYLNSPGPRDDGPRGFFINAVNWASSGSGLGIVALADGWAGTGSTWFTDTDSFLFDELNGNTSYFQEENVQILPGQEDFAVNEGLTTAGLSNWGTSSHMGFSVDTAGYEVINGAAGNDLFAVTIVTEGFADGDTGGGDDDDDDDDQTTDVPAPSTLTMLSLALLGIVYRKRSNR